jgi:hypothetical protein
MFKPGLVYAICGATVIVGLVSCSGAKSINAGPGVPGVPSAGESPTVGSGKASVKIDGKDFKVNGIDFPGDTNVDCHDVSGQDTYSINARPEDGNGSVHVRMTKADPAEVMAVTIDPGVFDEHVPHVDYSQDKEGYPTGGSTHASVTKSGETYTVSGRGIDGLMSGEPHEFVVKITCP